MTTTSNDAENVPHLTPPSRPSTVDPVGAYHADVIGSVYSARTNELIYRHQRSQLESDDDILSSITRIMDQSWPHFGGSNTRLERIRRWYEQMKDRKFQQYLRHINTRLERIPGQDQGNEPDDPDILAAENMLTFHLGLVEQLLTEELADRTYKPHSVAKLITQKPDHSTEV